MSSSSSKTNVLRCKETPMSSGLVYQHMSNHYRRILNAKPTVDTSTPKSFKPRLGYMGHQQQQHRRSSSLNKQDRFRTGSCNDLALIDRILETDECSPADVCRRQWSANTHRKSYGKEEYLNNINNPLTNARKSSERNSFVRKREPRRKNGDLMEIHKEQFQSYHLEFWPRILKTNATSKVKDMRVYYPPRRKAGFQKEQWAQSGSDREEDRQCSCSGECTCEGRSAEAASKEPSQASSRDSAYNGGISSDPESRSPTPCQPKNSVKNAETQTDVTTKRHQSVSKKMLGNRDATDSELAYTKFIHDLTAEILMKEQLSDKSMSKIINKHISANIAILDKNKMLKEVNKLRKELGMEFEDYPAPSPIVANEAAWDGGKKKPESWTSSYLKLMGINPRTTDLERSKGDVREERFTPKVNNGDEGKLFGEGERTRADYSESDSEEPSDVSSVEQTIKPSVDNIDWEDSADDVEESIEVGSSNYDDSFED